MLRNVLLFASLYCLTTACNQSSRPMPPGEQSRPPQTAAGEEACYLGTMKKDSVLLHISSLQPGQVQGDLQYKHFEKDSNQGTLRGELRGDTLLADYTFMSEGMESIRQVAFLRKGTDWVEGFGEVEDRNGKMVFKDPATLTFGHSWTLKKISCPNSK